MTIDLVSYARRIAFSIWNNPDAEGIAIETLFDCAMGYDPNKGDFIPYLRVAIKRRIWERWRTDALHGEVHKTDPWWMTVSETPPQDDSEPPVCQRDWMILWHHFIDKWPLDVIGREYGGVSRSAARKMVNAAKDRFLCAMENIK